MNHQSPLNHLFHIHLPPHSTHLSLHTANTRAPHRITTTSRAPRKSASTTTGWRSRRRTPIDSSRRKGCTPAGPRGLPPSFSIIQSGNRQRLRLRNISVQSYTSLHFIASVTCVVWLVQGLLLHIHPPFLISGLHTGSFN